MEVRLNNNDLEKALKLLKRKLQRDGLMGELKRRRFYEKPSVKSKNKQRQAKKRKTKMQNWKTVRKTE
ncbi:MAG: 30S ribosomal protein S21 [Nitrospirota bacterium]